MHLSLKTSVSVDEGDSPVNPQQLPADIVVLSFTDSDLAGMAQAYRSAGEGAPSLCLTSLAPMKHPLSVDLYIEQVARHAKVILVRLLGGQEWWRYGSEELGRVARENNIALVMVPGCGADERLTALSTVAPDMVAAMDECLAHGGLRNTQAVLQCLTGLARGEKPALPVAVPVASGALYREAAAEKPVGHAIILFYRAHYLAADIAPVDSLLQALAVQGLVARAFMVKSLKDAEALALLKAEVAAFPPDVVLDMTSFAAGDKAHPLAYSGVPVLQCALANAEKNVWEASPRGLSTTDLAMNVVLPEADGRIFTRAVSFKEQAAIDEVMQFSHIIHQPQDDRVTYVAELAAHWVRLAKKARQERKLALVLSNYPDRAGRNAYAVGLDGKVSVQNILRLLSENDYKTYIPELDFSDCPVEQYPLEAYRKKLDALPLSNRKALLEAWGEPQDDAFFKGGVFHLPVIRAGNVVVALQPDRGSPHDRKSGYHDAKVPPRHGYLAFYWWLRDVAGVDALIHLGTHGNLEWLPGKTAALSPSCWPEIALGALPVVYPYIVCDPGEAAQAKRRISAVMVSHLTPPLMPVGLSPELAELETLVDEFSMADGLDARRMKLLREEILHRARRSGMPGEDDNALMTALESHLCDIKEQRVGNGLHVFGQAPDRNACETMADALLETGADADKASLVRLLEQSAVQEAESLLAALDGKFIMPGSGGSPVRGRLDVLPTGRNLVTIDPRMIPTPTATLIGKRAAEEFIRRYTQDHGDWPKNIMMDIWGAATLRNGGDEIAQALWLMGIQPVWDKASGRVSGFDVVPDEQMQWPRIDVTLRVSGLFRDMFAGLIALFDDAVQAVHQSSGKTLRIFSNAPGAYGSGVNALVDSGRWAQRSELGQAYMEASHFAYGRDVDGVAQPELFKRRVESADALIHVQDTREMDVLSGADYADAEGGFAAAAHAMGNAPALYHLDTSRPKTVKVRSLEEEISLTLHARALNSEWIAGQMRHGYAGAASFADAVDQLFAFAATSDSVPSAQFDLLFDAYLHDENVRQFMEKENPEALAAIKARFEEAITRGLWNPLRNSVWILLDVAKGAAA